MKKTRKDGLWYNARDKEIGGIVLERHEARLGWCGPYPDARAGLRLIGVGWDTRTDIL